MPGIPERIRQTMIQFSGIEDSLGRQMRDEVKRLSPGNAERILNEVKEKGFSLGKMFEVVQFHIAGEITNRGTTIVSRAVTGGDDIGDDLGYGPATFLTRESVAEAAWHLLQISDSDFLTRFAPRQWDKGVTQEALPYFKEFVSYYDEAAHASHAMLVWGA